MAGTDYEFLGRLDPLEALAILDGLETADTTFLFEAYSLVLEPGLSRGNFDAIRALLETTPRADVARLLIAAFSDVWARVAPAETAAWIAALPPEADRTRVLGDVLTTWAAKEPEIAAAFASALPPGESRQVALKNVMLQWRTSDLAGASEWLNRSEPHPDFDAAIAALATDPRLAAVDPITSVGWAESIYSKKVRLETLEHIARTWAEHGAPGRAAELSFNGSPP